MLLSQPCKLLIHPIRPIFIFMGILLCFAKTSVSAPVSAVYFMDKWPASISRLTSSSMNDGSYGDEATDSFQGQTENKPLTQQQMFGTGALNAFIRTRKSPRSHSLLQPHFRGFLPTMLTRNLIPRRILYSTTAQLKPSFLSYHNNRDEEENAYRSKRGQPMNDDDFATDFRLEPIVVLFKP